MKKILEGEGKGANGVQSMKGKGEKSSGKEWEGRKRRHLFLRNFSSIGIYSVATLRAKLQTCRYFEESLNNISAPLYYPKSPIRTVLACENRLKR